MTEPDLFTELAYPNSPGARRNASSRAAAKAMKHRAPTLRDQVLDLLETAALTADEAAAVLRKSILAVRPRLSELLAMGKIVDTGRTRKNTSGVQATVWKAAERPPPNPA